MSADAIAVNLAVCEALGLDPAHIKAMTIRLAAGAAPVVEVIELPTKNDAGALVLALRSFTLVMNEDAS